MTKKRNHIHITKNLDKFENETVFFSEYEPYYSKDFGLSLYRHITIEEDILILRIRFENKSGYKFLEKSILTIIINNSENIELKKPISYKRYNEVQPYSSTNSYIFYDSYDYILTKDILLKLCKTETIFIKYSDSIYSVNNEFIDNCRIFFNEVYDSTLFIETIEARDDKITQRIKEIRSRQEEKEKEKEKALKRAKVKYYLTLGYFILVALPICLLILAFLGLIIQEVIL